MSKPKLFGLRIDVETRSSEDVSVGSYRYSEDPDFDMLIVCYAPVRQYAGGGLSKGAVRELDQYDQRAVDRFAELLEDSRYRKEAFNANFERVTLSRWIGMPTGEYIDPENWRCSSVRAKVHGVSGSLDEVAKTLRAPITKDPEGRRLINLFSKPDKKRGGLFHEMSDSCWCGSDHSLDAKKFVDYCGQDVMTEASVAHQLPEIPDDLQQQYEDDQRINDRGFLHDAEIAVAAVRQVDIEKNRLMGELKRLTRLDNPNSNNQMHEWLNKMDYPMTSLNKESREEAINDPLVPDEVAEVLTLKGEASLSSVAKHKKAMEIRCEDGRIRGSIDFHKAHTGRFGGRGIQPHNLPRDGAPESDRLLLVSGNAGRRAPEIAKGTVRSSIVPAPGHIFVTCDYNAIEGRVLGWHAGEVWVENEFRGDGKLYEATAEMMFDVGKHDLLNRLSACGKCGMCEACEIRDKAKVSNLALGFNGGAGALVNMGAEQSGIDIGNYKEINAEWVAKGRPGKFFQYEADRHDYPELLRLRDLYRAASPATTQFWKTIAKAWDLAARDGKAVRFGSRKHLVMMRDGAHNRLVLPSGRSIWYRYAKSHPDPDNPERIDRRTFIGKGTGVGHRRLDIHGGVLTNNVTQGTARDVMVDLITKLEQMTASGWPGRVVLHVHDEVVLEVKKKHADQVLADVLGMMDTPPDWAQDLPIKGAGSLMERYAK